ncbi:hypothetical protein COU80_02570 [Candidatus Peregrinibacteria bacterium CG10_big_fil_rev_8_21_14_0_10_55_24]|nr:MAG: hypothetical protein COU80_02570 [Candidatus Peregrinibacteria bacterium CG10_big_fil_rev_8_21_14_0_10_55_24]
MGTEDILPMEEAPADHPGFEPFSITFPSEPGVSARVSVEGEKYYKQLPDGPEGPRYETTFDRYGLRFPSACSSDQFFQAFNRAFGPTVRTSRFDAASRDERSVEHSSPLMQQGIILFPTKGDSFGVPLDPFLQDGGWEQLSGEPLQELLRTRFRIRETVEPAVYRVNTMIGDVLFSPRPEEEDDRPGIGIISHRNLAEEIATLHELTAQVRGNRTALQTALSVHLSCFPKPYRGAATA